MTQNQFSHIFKKGSITYFYSSLFFPPKIRDDVFTLYAFVRTADDYVDAIPQQTTEFMAFEKETVRALEGKQTHNEIIHAFRDMVQRKKFDMQWVISFLNAMKQDITKKTYHTFEELENYMYGSAEVIGLMMARICNIPEKAFPYAQLQGKAMQLINFIRDLKEDIMLGRMYLPVEDMKRFGIKSLPPKTPQEIKAFISFILFEIERYELLQKEAEKGYQDIPRPLRIPIKTAARIYLWTANQIKKQPLIVFEKKVKPCPAYVVWEYAKNALSF